MWYFEQFHQKIDRFIFLIIGEKASTNLPFEKDVLFKKNGKNKCLCRST